MTLRLLKKHPITRRSIRRWRRPDRLVGRWALTTTMAVLWISVASQAGEPLAKPSFALPRAVIGGLADPLPARRIKAPVIAPDQRPVEAAVAVPTPAAESPPVVTRPRVRPVVRVTQAEPKPKALDAGDPKQLRKITTIRPFQDYSPSGQPLVTRKPVELKLGGSEFPSRVFESQVYRWTPSDLYHFPLYFEDPPLERYGHTHHELLQPFISAHRFGTQLIGLPYQMTIDPVLKKTYALGWYRPGEPAPKLLYQVPWNAEAAAAQAGVMTGLFFLVP